MSFADELLPAWNEAISPAIAAAGYDSMRIDSEQNNAGIVDVIKAKIRQADSRGFHFIFPKNHLFANYLKSPSVKD